MKRQIFVFAILVALTLVANVPKAAFAQTGQAAQLPPDRNYAVGQQGPVNPSQLPAPSAAVIQNQPGQAGRKVPEPKGGVATVIGVDQPENCLRIRSGPGSSYDVMGCVGIGQQLNITGIWTSNNWAQLVGNGWVYGPQIQTDLQPPWTANSPNESYVAVQEEYPAYYSIYPDAYLPDYGYTTYWYGGLPLFVYDINVWRRHHPWWWYKNRNHGPKVWNSNHDFRRGVTTGSQRNFVANRSGASSANVTRFNATRFRSGSPNVVQSGRTFSSPTAVRMGNFRAGQFSGARVGGFSSARIGGAGFGGARFGGGGGGRRR